MGVQQDISIGMHGGCLGNNVSGDNIAFHHEPKGLGVTFPHLDINGQLLFSRLYSLENPDPIHSGAYKPGVGMGGSMSQPLNHQSKGQYRISCNGVG